MKRYISSATEFGTTFYKFKLSDLQEHLSEADRGNIVFSALLEKDGLDAIDVDHMPGSFVKDDVLYVCETDGENIVIGDRDLDPEAASSEVSAEEIANSRYVEEGTKDDTIRLLTKYEFKPYDRDEIAEYLIKTKGFKFSEVEEALKSLED